MESQLEKINIGLDEYMDVVSQIEEINKKVNAEKRKITDEEAKKELRLLIQLLEFRNSRVSIEEVPENKIHNSVVKEYTLFGKFYLATTKVGKYECVIVDDMPCMFRITSVEGSRQLASVNLMGNTYKHSLHIDLDKKWYEDRMHDLVEILENI